MPVRFYRWLLRLYPRAYRSTFGSEMADVFGQAQADAWKRGRVCGAAFCIREFAGLFLGAMRERARGSEILEQAAARSPAYDGVPAFYTCEQYSPRRSALIQGGILSLVFFSAVTAAFEYGVNHRTFRLPAGADRDAAEQQVIQTSGSGLLAFGKSLVSSNDGAAAALVLGRPPAWAAIDVKPASLGLKQVWSNLLWVLRVRPEIRLIAPAALQIAAGSPIAAPGDSAIAQAARVPGPSEFYAVAVSFSDYGPSSYYRVLDVKPDGPDSLIRYARIAPTNIFCPRLMVQAAEARVRNTSPAQLLKSNNPCAIQPTDLRTTIDENKQNLTVFDTISFGIVAKCVSSTVIFSLPIPEQVNLKRMKRAHPEMARLWDLTSKITDRVFGSHDIFHDRTEEDNLALQRTGEKLAAELASSRYDPGLAAAVKGKVGAWDAASFRSILEDYRGPVSAAEANQGYVPELANAQSYRFIHFVAPKYPPLAQHARIQGKVKLQLKVNPATGEVQTASTLSGHPLLAPSAIDAAKQWRFEPKSVASDTVNLTIDFALRCP